MMTNERHAEQNNIQESAISIRNLRKSFDGREYVLNGINLEIPKGKITVLIGFSGTGKSVLLKHILGLMPPSEGEIAILGKSLAHLSAQDAIRLRSNLGVLFQDAALFDDMTALENVCFPLTEHRRQLSQSEIKHIALAKLKVVGLDENSVNRFPNEMSGGMRKRVGLARALALDPEIILYDEPTTGLDPIRTEIVDNLIVSTQQHKKGMTSVVVTHDLQAAFRFADFIAMLHGGEVILTGTPQDFLTTENELVRRFVSKGVDRE